MAAAGGEEAAVASEQKPGGSLADLAAAVDSARQLAEDAEASAAPEKQEAAEKARELQVELEASRSLVEQLRRQMIQLSNRFNMTQNGLQNEVQAAHKLLAELKLEYEEFSEVSIKESATAIAKREQDLAQLRKDFEQFRVMQFEDKQQLLREHQEVVRALHTQFEEYRDTAEFLFRTEAAKLEARFKTQTEKYENELRHIIKAKDRQYDDMTTAKDAKIMNLIEGTDFQNILMQHDLELQQLRNQQKDNEDKVRRDLAGLHRRERDNLERQMQAKDVENEGLRNKLNDQADKMRTTYALVTEGKAQAVRSLAQHEAQMRSKQADLDTATSLCQLRDQEKQNLRHKLVRLQMRLKCQSSLTTADIVRKLQQDSAQLVEQVSANEAAISTLVVERDSAINRARAAERQSGDLGDRLVRLEGEYCNLASAFEAQLKHRAARRSVAWNQATASGAPEAGASLLTSSSSSSSSSSPPGSHAGKKPRDVEAAVAAAAERDMQRGIRYMKRFREVSKAFRGGTFDPIGGAGGSGSVGGSSRKGGASRRARSAAKREAAAGPGATNSDGTEQELKDIAMMLHGRGGATFPGPAGSSSGAGGGEEEGNSALHLYRRILEHERDGQSGKKFAGRTGKPASSPSREAAAPPTR